MQKLFQVNFDRYIFSFKKYSFLTLEVFMQMKLDKVVQLLFCIITRSRFSINVKNSRFKIQ